MKKRLLELRNENHIHYRKRRGEEMKTLRGGEEVKRKKSEERTEKERKTAIERE